MKIRLTNANTGSKMSVDIKKVVGLVENPKQSDIDENGSVIHISTDRGIKHVRIAEGFPEFLDAYNEARNHIGGYENWTASEDRMLTWALNKIVRANKKAGITMDWFDEQRIDCFLCDYLYDNGSKDFRYFVYSYVDAPTGMETFSREK